MKKAISPLIGYVLLVGFMITMGAIVTIWIVGIAKKTEFEDPKIICSDVSLSIDEYCHAGDTLKLTLNNRGNFIIRQLSLALRYDNMIHTYNAYHYIPPQSSVVFSQELNPAPVVWNLSTITITPWAKTKEIKVATTVSCTDQAIKAENLNIQPCP